MYVPWFLILKFIFFFGWLHVSEVLLNPFGNDDEDFDMTYIINRNVQISYLMVEGSEDGLESLEDPYCGAIPTSLPHTVDSFKFMPTQPLAFPTDDLRGNLTKQEMAYALEDGKNISIEGYDSSLEIESINPAYIEDAGHLRSLDRNPSLKGSIRMRTRTVTLANLNKHP